MPLEQLRQYEGRNPRPTDFDAYWERALMEMRAVDPKVELAASDFQVPYAECFDLYFTGVRGARIHAKYIRPRHAAEPHPAVLQFHGYTLHSGDWQDKLAYAALGYSVFAMDCRGQGGDSEDVGGVKGNTHQGHIIRGLEDREAYTELRMFFRRFDPQHKREQDIFTRLGYIDLQHLARRIRGEVLFGIGLMDVICPPSTQFAVYNKITAPKQMEIYPDFGHEDLPAFKDKTMQFFAEERFGIWHRQGGGDLTER